MLMGASLTPTKAPGSPTQHPERCPFIVPHLSGKRKDGTILKKPTITLDVKLTGKKLRTAIMKSGYSVRELQKMLYLACPQPIYRWMNGDMLPSVDNLYRLSYVLNTQMEDLVTVKFTRENMNCITLDKEMSSKKLHTAIIRSGYSIEELQNMLQLSCPKTIYRWIQGDTLPSMDNLYKLSLILNTSMENLIVFKF